MVKSYRGVGSIKTAEPKIQAVNVENYMTRQLVTFHPDQTMDQVVETLLSKKISGGPVIDEEGTLVGIISEGDCLKEVVKGKYNNSPTMSGTVSEHMATDVITVTPEMNVFELAQMFLSKKLRRFPVLREGKLVGQISQKDVMRAVIKLKGTTW